jgi:hypothetical protein
MEQNLQHSKEQAFVLTFSGIPLWPVDQRPVGQ